MILFDTDVLIWVERGNSRAASLIDNTETRNISVQTYMEFLQGARSKSAVQRVKDFLADFDFRIIPLTENIGHRASIYIEEYAAICGIQVGDAVIAATAVENHLTLITGNQKHFSPIQDLKLKLFTA